MNFRDHRYIERLRGIPRQISAAALWHILTGAMTLYVMLRIITPDLVSQIEKFAAQGKTLHVELAKDMIAFANSISTMAAASLVLGLAIAAGRKWAWVLALASNLAGISIVVRRPFMLIVNGSPSYLLAALLPVVFLLPTLALYSKRSRAYCGIEGARLREIVIAVAILVLLIHFGVIALFDWYEEILMRIEDLP